MHQGSRQLLAAVTRSPTHVSNASYGWRRGRVNIATPSSKLAQQVAPALLPTDPERLFHEVGVRLLRSRCRAQNKARGNESR